MTTDRLLDSREVAELLGVPVSTLHYLHARGDGPPVIRIGKRNKYRTADVEAFIRARTKAHQPA